jgi:hypothetical protein
LPGLPEAEPFIEPFDPQLGQDVSRLFFRVATELTDPLPLGREIDMPFSIFEFEIPIISLFDHRAPP